MDITELVEHIDDAATVRRVYGEPIVRDGVTVVPVAKVSGGGGGGSGKQEGDHPGEGGGGGFGLNAAPAGVFVIRADRVHWKPAIDVNRVILGGQIVAMMALFTVRVIMRLRAKAGAGKGK